jgi:hypothetical protein
MRGSPHTDHILACCDARCPCRVTSSRNVQHNPPGCPMACVRRPRAMTLALLWLGGIAVTGVWPRAVYGHAHHGASTDDHSGGGPHSAPGASGALSPAAADVLHLAGDGGAGRAVLGGDAVTVAWAVHTSKDTVTFVASTAKPC